MTVIAIPALDPTDRLTDLVTALRGRDPAVDIVVVDDGSAAASADVFAAVSDAGATVLRHGRNRGKGAALRTAFRYARDHHPGASVVTADSDGQHTPDDILRVAHATRSRRHALVLGVRSFAGPDVPGRSRFGNRMSSRLFALVIGHRVADTQTGLRGLTPSAVSWAIELPGDRFEYETVMLLAAPRAAIADGTPGLDIVQVPIETVYLEDNRGSHFRPLLDSVRVLGSLFAYLGSSLFAAVIDAALLWLFYASTGWLVTSIVAARAISATVNFIVNRELVFRRAGDRPPLRVELTRYTMVAAAVLTANVVLMKAAAGLGVDLALAKVATETSLWIVGFVVQRLWVFASGREGRRRPTVTDEPDAPLLSGTATTAERELVGAATRPIRNP